ncbi:MAG: hypothetical protein PHP62_05935 [Candidatus Moranbacteria bacterium]|nr:hypothetical protein [Candidatus Moranbacteria bacterium]
MGLRREFNSRMDFHAVIREGLKESRIDEDEADLISVYAEPKEYIPKKKIVLPPYQK